MAAYIAEFLAKEHSSVVPILIKPGAGGLDLRPEQVETLLKSDIVVLVLRLDFTSLRNARQTLEHLERLGVNRNKIQLLVNRQGQPKGIRISQAEEALGTKIFGDIPQPSPRFLFGRGRFLFGGD